MKYRKRKTLYRFGNRLCAFLVAATLTWCFWTGYRSRNEQICIFGRAVSTESAKKSLKQWPGLMSWFLIDDNPKFLRSPDKRIHFLSTSTTNASDSWDIALEQSKQYDVHCEYIFIMDDDFEWISNRPKHDKVDTQGDEDTSKSNVDNLSRFLEAYKPAVTVFPWNWGDVHYENLNRMNLKYLDEEIQPATGFDHRIAIVHSSVLPWMVSERRDKYPYQSQNLVQHTLRNILVPYVYRRHAIRYNGIAYLSPPRIMKREFNQFTFQWRDEAIKALRCPHGRWGPDLAPEDVSWAILPGHPPYDLNIYRLATIVRVSHPIISNHSEIARHHSIEKLKTIDAFVESVLSPELFCTEHAYLIIDALRP
jgi:hypothetical protein